MLRRSNPPRTLPRLRALPRGRWWLTSCGLLTTLLAVFFLYYPPDLLRFLDYRIYDLMLGQRSAPEPKQLPVVVGIDERSLAAFGQWPWPRYRLAQLLDELRRQGVAAVGLDMLLPEEDRTSPEVILRERRRDLGEDPSVSHWSQLGLQNDQRLAMAIQQLPVVLGYQYIYVDEEPLPPQGRLSPLVQIIVSSAGAPGVDTPEPRGMLLSLEGLRRVAHQNGFVNVAKDSDGVLRRAPLIVRYQGDHYPSLALATVLAATGEHRLVLELRQGEAHLQLGRQQIALDGRGQLLIGFASEQSFRYLSAAELLQQRLPENSLAGALVFVGAQAAGLGDRHVTPIDRSFAGPAVHALIAANLLNGGWLSHPVWARGLELLLTLGFGLLSTLLFCRYGLLAMLALLLIGGGGLGMLSLRLFVVDGNFLSPTLPLLVLITNTALLGLLRYGIEARNLRQRDYDLLKSQDATIVSLTTLADTRDQDTGAHILRTQRYVKSLAQQLVRQGSPYRAELGDEEIELLFKSAPLHDIGKVGIPDRILLKQGGLDDEELAVMRNHTRLGAEALQSTADVLEDPAGYAFLRYARQMAAAHHERWDGTGYPEGLAGLQIPLAGRLMAVADVYDALRSRRPYKEPISHENTRDYILARSGSLFDPQIVTAFSACAAEFRQIAAEFQDETSVAPDEGPAA